MKRLKRLTDRWCDGTRVEPLSVRDFKRVRAYLLFVSVVLVVGFGSVIVLVATR